MAITLEQAQTLVLADLAALPAESVPVDEAAGRVLAGDLTALIDSPPDTNSAMDGFAVASGAAGRTMRLIGESRAGAPSPLEVGPGTAIRIATGGVLPAGADAVVALERASVSGGLLTVREAVGPGHNVRAAGESVRAGQVVLGAGLRLGPAELTVAIGAGHGAVDCRRRPRVALLGTGDELREPGTRLTAGQIHDSNTIALAALCAEAGASVVRRARCGDEPGDIRRELAEALAQADLVVVSGGVSVGPHDHVKAALSSLGVQERFWGVKIRPGRPTWFGRRGDVLVLGVPGNPLSAMVIFILLGRPMLAALEGIESPPTRERARLATPLIRHPERTDAVRVLLEVVDGEGLRAVPSGPQGSHLPTSMLAAGGLALVPAGRRELAAGSEVEVEWLRRRG